jgi:hypothetical protein
MNKPMHAYSLAIRLLSSNGSFVANIRRIQNGFLPERNIKEARELLEEFKSTLDQIEHSLRYPPQADHNHIPLK